MKPAMVVLVLVCALIGVGLYALIAEVDHLSCDRAADTCTLRQEKPHGSTTSSFPARSLRGAEVRGASTGKRSTARRVVLLTEAGPVSLMGYATGVGIGGMEEIAAEVRAFVSDPGRPSLDVRRDNRLLSFLVALVPPIFAVVMASFDKRTTPQAPKSLVPSQ
jgi:hypothetical protein